MIRNERNLRDRMKESRKLEKIIDDPTQSPLIKSFKSYIIKSNEEMNIKNLEFFKRNELSYPELKKSEKYVRSVIKRNIISIKNSRNANRSKSTNGVIVNQTKTSDEFFKIQKTINSPPGKVKSNLENPINFEINTPINQRGISFHTNLGEERYSNVLSQIEVKADKLYMQEGIIQTEGIKNNEYLKNNRKLSRNKSTSPRKFKRNGRVVDTELEENDDEFESQEAFSFFIIPENSNFSKFLDFTVFCILCYYIIIGPLILAFPLFFNESHKLEITMDIIMIIDFISNFFTTFTNNNDDQVHNLKSIFVNYSNTYLWEDLVTSLPFSLIYYNSPNSLAYRVLKLLRILRSIKVSDRIDINKIKYIEKLDITTTNRRLFTFFITFCSLSHILTSIWIFLSQLGGERNWIVSANIVGYSNFELYITSCYFNWTTIFTVGYGDILSVNIYERFYNIFIMFFGVLIYSYAVTSIGSMLTKQDKETKKHNKFLESLEELREKFPEIDEILVEETESLYNKIIKFLNYNHKTNTNEKIHLVQELPQKVKQLILLKMYDDSIQKSNFFKPLTNSYDDELFKLNTILSIRPLKAFKNEFILKASDKFDDFFLIKKGLLMIEFYSEYSHRNHKLITLRKNDYFGLNEILENESSLFNFRVKSEFLELYFIKKEDIMNLHKQFPNIVTKILEISGKKHQFLLDLKEKKDTKLKNLFASPSRDNDSEFREKLDLVDNLENCGLDANLSGFDKDQSNSHINTIRNMEEKLTNIVMKPDHQHDYTHPTSEDQIQTDQKLEIKNVYKNSLNNLADEKFEQKKKLSLFQNTNSQNNFSSLENDNLKKKQTNLIFNNYQTKGEFQLSKLKSKNHVENNSLFKKRNTMSYESRIKIAKKNLNENLKFQKNPEKFMLTEFKHVFSKHINSEKKDFSLLIQRLDYLKKSLKSNYIKK